MGEDRRSKWQEEVDAILREKYQGDELLKRVKVTTQLVEFFKTVEKPSGIIGDVIGNILKAATEELPTLPAAYTAFQVGVAYERYQNANRD